VITRFNVGQLVPTLQFGDNAKFEQQVQSNIETQLQEFINTLEYYQRQMVL